MADRQRRLRGDRRRWRFGSRGPAAARRLRFPLELAARVRRPLSVDAERVDFGLIAPGAPVSRTLTVRNHGGADWAGPPTASTPADWLSLRVRPAPDDTPGSAGDGAESRQTFAVELTATLPAGADPPPAAVRVAAGGNSRTVRVTARRDVGVRVLPAQFYFGSVRPGRPSEARAGVRLARGLTFDPAALRLAPNDLPGTLTVAATWDGDLYWRLTARYEPAEGFAGVVDERVTLRLGPGLPPAEMSVRALVSGGR